MNLEWRCWCSPFQGHNNWVSKVNFRGDHKWWLVLWGPLEMYPQSLRAEKQVGGNSRVAVGLCFSLPLLFHPHHKLNRELRRERKTKKMKTEIQDKRPREWCWNDSKHLDVATERHRDCQGANLRSRMFLPSYVSVCTVTQICPLLATPWIAARQAPLSMESSRQ